MWHAVIVENEARLQLIRATVSDRRPGTVVRH